MWWKRCAPSAPSSTGRTRCLWASVASSDPTRGATSGGARAVTAASGKTYPTTDAGSITERSLDSSVSSRDARSAWIVGGTLISESSSVNRHVPSSSAKRRLVHEHPEQLLREERVPLGRRDDAIQDDPVERRRRRAGSRSCSSSARSSSGSRTMRADRAPVLHCGDSSRSSGRVGHRTSTGASCTPRPGARSGRAASARPSGCPPPRRSTGCSAARWLEELPHGPEQLLDRERLDRQAEQRTRGEPSRRRPPGPRVRRASTAPPSRSRR